MEVKTDNKYRPLKALWQLPKKVAKDFDYMKGRFEDEDSIRFVKYQGKWYDTQDTYGIVTDSSRIGWVRPVSKNHILANWHAIREDTFFSAMVFKFSEDWESVIVGVYYA